MDIISFCFWSVTWTSKLSISDWVRYWKSFKNTAKYNTYVLLKWCFAIYGSHLNRFCAIVKELKLPSPAASPQCLAINIIVTCCFLSKAGLQFNFNTLRMRNDIKCSFYLQNVIFKVVVDKCCLKYWKTLHETSHSKCEHFQNPSLLSLFGFVACFQRHFLLLDFFSLKQCWWGVSVQMCFIKTQWKLVWSSL